MNLGASFSHPFLKSKGINPLIALSDFKTLGFTWIRLGCYWNEIEKSPGQFSFAELDVLIKYCEQENIKVVLTVGMKAPRWPEYYIPAWITTRHHFQKNTIISLKDTDFGEAVLTFIKKCIYRYRNSPAIIVWQVENEPLDPSGPQMMSIAYPLLKEEVGVVRRIDNRPILVSVWGNELSKRNYYQDIVSIADIVGIDLYPRVPFNLFRNIPMITGPQDIDFQLQNIFKCIKLSGKELWISELQAEPWTITKTCLSKHIKENNTWISHFPIDKLFYWGYEYWLQQKSLGNFDYWNTVRFLVESII